MSVPDPAGRRADEHAARLQALSRPGGPLDPNGTESTTHNSAWFLRVGGRAVPVENRRELHRALLAGWEAQAPRVGAERQAIVLAGPPGAGKSTAQKALLDAANSSPEQWRVINSDDFKDLLLEAALQDGSYPTLLPEALRELEAGGERFWPRELAALVHEEASLLVEAALSAAIARGENIVLDGTLSNQQRADALLQRLATARYAVRVADIEAPEQIVRQRIAARWRTDYLAAETGTAKDPQTARLGGRWVPSELLADLYPHPSARSVCAAVARSVAERHGCVSEYFAYHVATFAAAPELAERRGRAAPSAPLIDAEAAEALRIARQGQPPPATRPGRSSSPRQTPHP